MSNERVTVVRIVHLIGIALGVGAATVSDIRFLRSILMGILAYGTVFVGAIFVSQNIEARYHRRTSRYGAPYANDDPACAGSSFHFATSA